MRKFVATEPNDHGLEKVQRFLLTEERRLRLLDALGAAMLLAAILWAL